MGEKKQIRISVKDKIACLVDKEQFLVCGNNDYEVVFDFDSDWEGISAKTAVFVYGNTPVHKPFVGNVCEGIEIKNATLCAIGVFAGDIKTTTGATIECRQSIRDIGGVPKPPTKEVYDEIMALLDKAIEAHTELPVGGKAGQVLKKVSDKDYDTEWANDEQRDLTEIDKKIESLDTVIKQNAESLTNKLDKTTEANKIYGTDKDGNQTQVKYSSNVVADSVAQRTWDGQLYIAKNPNESPHCATSRHYVDGLVNPLEERVTNLENLTLTYTEDTSTAYEKAVPAEVGKYALVKMIGGATEKVVSKNILNPIDIGGFYTTDPEHPITYEYNKDGTITYTIGWDGFCVFDLWDFPVGRYYLYLENASIQFLDEANVEILLDSDYNPETNPDFTTCTKTLKVMIWQDTSVTTDTYEIVEAPEGTVFEPYIPTFQHAETERIESIGANLFDRRIIQSENKSGVTVDYNAETQVFTLNGTVSIPNSYALTYINLKGKKGEKYVIKTEVLNGNINVPSGKDAVAYFGSADEPNQSSNWGNASLKTSNSKIYTLPHEYITSFWFFLDAGVVLNNLQVRIMIAKADSDIPYKPYSAEPIDSITIPEAVRNLDGYGIGVDSTAYNYIEIVDDKVFYHKVVGKVDLGTLPWEYKGNNRFSGYLSNLKLVPTTTVPSMLTANYRTVTNAGTWVDGDISQYSNTTAVGICDSNYTDANAFKEAKRGEMLYYELATPKVTDITDLFTEGNKLQVQQGGAIRFVNERKMAIPNTVAFIKRKE